MTGNRGVKKLERVRCNGLEVIRRRKRKREVEEKKIEP